ncbi:hypothetical protein BD626DRAFT_482018 [Schizophyllum amplum]|uniref:Uncharacterized protein n=1 Tax=Schizophyllum amplum TaxID=97359 RepID=A0A550CUR9_9AGAR|nr:hypothetical protein BD626DRAFT_482018 [Auriculariopsis ampla]
MFTGRRANEVGDVHRAQGERSRQRSQDRRVRGSPTVSRSASSMISQLPWNRPTLSLLNHLTLRSLTVSRSAASSTISRSASSPVPHSASSVRRKVILYDSWSSIGHKGLGRSLERGADGRRGPYPRAEETDLQARRRNFGLGRVFAVSKLLVLPRSTSGLRDVHVLLCQKGVVGPRVLWDLLGTTRSN